jgi:hypothetical protein
VTTTHVKGHSRKFDSDQPFSAISPIHGWCAECASFVARNFGLSKIRGERDVESFQGLDDMVMWEDLAEIYSETDPGLQAWGRRPIVRSAFQSSLAKAYR